MNKALYEALAISVVATLAGVTKIDFGGVNAGWQCGVACVVITLAMCVAFACVMDAQAAADERELALVRERRNIVE